MLQDKAMLANLTVRAWSARKRDKDVSEEVEIKHMAKDAGNFNKLLIDKTALKPIVTLSGTLRDTHYKMTLPWGDNGDRLLPSKMYFEYCKTMQGLKDQFNTAVKHFCANYPNYKQDARTRLGTMYDAEDYPDVSLLSRKFEARTSFLPIPDAEDFRVDLGADEVAEIKDDIRKQIATQQEAAIRDLWERLKDVVERIHERLSDPEAVFRDSLIENTQFACSIAEKLNIQDDANLEAVRRDIEHRLCRVAPQRLRDDAVLRKQIADAAADILNKFPTW
jgi:hypothetical protein